MTTDFTAYLECWQYVRPCGHEAGGWSLCQHMPQPLTLETLRAACDRLLAMTYRPAEPDPVSPAEFQRLIRMGVIDEDGRVLPCRYVPRRDDLIEESRESDEDNENT